VNADDALRALSDSYWTNVDQAKRMAEAIDTVGLEIERLRRRKRDLAEIMTADEIIAVERARLARLVEEERRAWLRHPPVWTDEEVGSVIDRIASLLEP